MNTDKLYLPALILGLFFLNLFDITLAMDDEIAEKSENMNSEQSNFNALPLELNLDIMLRNLDLENINSKELPIVLSEFWKFAQVSPSFRFISENCLSSIIANIYRRFGIDGLIEIWNSQMPKDHPIRNAVLDYCNHNNEKILMDLDLINICSLLHDSYDSAYTYRNGKCYMKQKKQEFLLLKFYLETDLMPGSEKQYILNKMKESTRRIKNKSEPFLISIIQSGKVGFNEINIAELEDISELSSFWKKNNNKAQRKISSKDYILSQRDYNALIFFAKYGYLEQLILSKNLMPKNLSELLFAGAENGQYNVVEFLINQEVDINVKNISWSTPLMYAARGGYYKICQLLLNKGACIDGRTNLSKKTALIFAVENGHSRLVQMLMDKGASVSESDGYNAVLHIASLKGHLNIVKLLLQKGASIHAVNSEGNTPLMLAARAGELKTVAFLLKSGARINDQNERGATALSEAVLYGQLDVIKLLLENKADVHLHDAGEKALAIDIWHSERKCKEIINKIRSILIEHGAIVNF